MKSVACYVPVFSSTKWAVKSVELNVKGTKVFYFCGMTHQGRLLTICRPGVKNISLLKTVMQIRSPLRLLVAMKRLKLTGK